MPKIRLLITLFCDCSSQKKLSKNQFYYCFEQIICFKTNNTITEVSLSCILGCKFKNLTSMYANKRVRCLFLVSICTLYRAPFHTPVSSSEWDIYQWSDLNSADIFRILTKQQFYRRNSRLCSIYTLYNSKQYIIGV